MGMLAHGARKRPDMHNLALDVDYLGHRFYRTPADHNPSTFANRTRILCSVKEGPRQAGLVLGVEVNFEINWRKTRHMSPLLFFVVQIIGISLFLWPHIDSASMSLDRL
jgi:hypothetical protein